jgi:hypothetical protein
VLAPFGQLVSASELCRWIVDQKFGDDGQKCRHFPIPHTDQAVKDPIQIRLVAERVRFPDTDHQARHTEEIDGMPMQRTANGIPK